MEYLQRIQELHETFPSIEVVFTGSLYAIAVLGLGLFVAYVADELNDWRDK